MKEKILITGGSGLLALNWALTMRENYELILGLHTRLFSMNGVKTLPFLLDDFSEILNSLKSIKPTLLIHAAGLTNVEACEANPELAHHVNVDLSENLAKACAASGISLVYISTDHLFSTNTPFLDEKHPLRPLNIYAKTKALAEEKILLAYPQALIIRTNFYGWGPPYRHSFSDIVISSLRENKTVHLFQDVFYTPILIETLVKTVQGLVDSKAKGIFHVVGDERVSKYEFGIQIAERFNLNPDLIKSASLKDQPKLVKRPFEMSLSNKKTCELLGKNLGGLKSHLDLLAEQEKRGFAREIQNL